MEKARKVKETTKNSVSFISKIKGVNKKVWMIAGGSAAAVVVILIAVLCIVNGSNQSKLEARMKELAVDFYENFYYDSPSTEAKEKAEFVKKYEKTGIKIDLSNLSRYAGSKKGAKKELATSILSEFKNSKTDKECDANQTKAIIYPQDPYGKKDYKLEIVLSCGFKDETKTEKK